MLAFTSDKTMGSAVGSRIVTQTCLCSGPARACHPLCMGDTLGVTTQAVARSGNGWGLGPACQLL